MAECPFCKSSVPESMVLYGGRCPSCFGDIPGEEAATDPGEAVKEILRTEAIQHARRRALAPVLVLAPLTLVGIGAAWWFLQPPPEVEPLIIEDLGQEFTFQPYEGSAEQLAEKAAEEAVAKAAKVAKAPKAPKAVVEGRSPAADDKRSPSEPHRQVVEGEASLGGARQVAGAQAPGQVDRAGVGLTAGGGGGSSDFVDIGIAAERTAAMLTERSDIERAVKDVLRARGGRLQQCYEQALKANGGLQGVWKVSFTIGRDGQFSGVKAAASGMSDAGFEQCVVRQVDEWSLRARLAEPMPVTLPLTFKAN